MHVQRHMTYYSVSLFTAQKMGQNADAACEKSLFLQLELRERVAVFTQMVLLFNH